MKFYIFWIASTVLAATGPAPPLEPPKPIQNAKSWREYRDSLGVISLIDLLTIAITAADIGGEVLVDVRKGQNLGVREKDGPNDLVTYADEESNRRIVAIFQSVFSNLPRENIRSEETTEPDTNTTVLVNKPSPKIRRYVLKNLGIVMNDSPLESDSQFKRLEQQRLRKMEELYWVSPEDVTVWIDPMDATKEYIENLTVYTTVMIGIAVKGKPVIGVIRKPFKDSTYWGINWQGVFSTVASKPEKGIRWEKLRDNYKKSANTFIVSRSHPGDVGQKLRRSFKISDGIKIIKAGGAGYKSVQVLNGLAGSYIHTGKIKLWDLCAPSAILNAAGGKLTDLAGLEINYNFDESEVHYGGVIASMTQHDRMVDLKLRE